jgi:hypothetical protein
MRDELGRPQPELQAAALRYAADDLTPDEKAAFESRLEGDQSAREAVAEAVRLSAAALGQDAPTPDRSFRFSIRDTLRGCRSLLPRRAYRGSPVFWTGVGLTAAVALFVFTNSEPAATPASETQAASVQPHVEVKPTPAVPEPKKNASTPRVPAKNADPRAAEIWAELSTPDHLERVHDEELRRRQRQRDWDRHVPPSTMPPPTTGLSVTPEPVNSDN